MKGCCIFRNRCCDVRVRCRIRARIHRMRTRNSLVHPQPSTVRNLDPFGWRRALTVFAPNQCSSEEFDTNCDCRSRDRKQKHRTPNTRACTHCNRREFLTCARDYRRNGIGSPRFSFIVISIPNGPFGLTPKSCFSNSSQIASTILRCATDRTNLTCSFVANWLCDAVCPQYAQWHGRSLPFRPVPSLILKYPSQLEIGHSLPM
jgi:hypothetical protein